MNDSIHSASHEGAAMNASKSIDELLSDFLNRVEERDQLAANIDAAQQQLAAAKTQLQEMRQNIELALAAAGAPAGKS
jgi:predicted  nucleic acid-binding Zn-ribbon protein